MKFPSRSGTKKLENARKMTFCKKKRKELGKCSRMIFAIFDGFGLILMVFIDQNMRIHDFPVPGQNLGHHFDDFETDFVQHFWEMWFFLKTFCAMMPKRFFNEKLTLWGSPNSILPEIFFGWKFSFFQENFGFFLLWHAEF